MSKLNPDEHICIDLDLDELDLTSAEAKATYSKIQGYVSDNFGIRVSSGEIALVKRKYGLKMGMNYNLPKTYNYRPVKCSAEKEGYITNALRHFKML